MKNITALVTLFCLMGLAGAQGSGLGDGYSSTQRAFFNEPITSTFEPYVNNYWRRTFSPARIAGIAFSWGSVGSFMPCSFSIALIR